MSIKWDVPKGQRITYFDPTLSYEITGYRPINMTEGLDFDVTPFVEVGRFKETAGRYTTLPKGSRNFVNWWKEQYRRCKYGFESNGYRITGDHYFFLNFHTLMKVDINKKAGEGRDDGRPDFRAKQYEYFHYIEMCETLKRDVIAFKARGVGFSEIATALAVRPYITNPRYQTVVTAFSEGLLEPTLSKAWNQLEYLNQETEGGMLRLRQNINTSTHKEASVKDSSGNVKGHKSEIKGIVVDNPRKLRGRRVDRLIFEEAGSNPVLRDTYVKGEALVEIEGTKIGTRIVFGTGGDSGAPLASLETMFKEVEGFGGLPYKHNHTRDGSTAMTGFFVPAHTCVTSFIDRETGEQVRCIDERGVTNEILAKKYYDSKRLALANSPTDLANYCAEYCYFPEEALSKQGVNDFDQGLLAEQYTRLEILKQVEKPTKGDLFWVYENENTGSIKGVRWVPSPTGRIEITEHPVEGKPNLYIAGVDSIDLGVIDSVVREKGSKFCIVVKKRDFGNSGNKYVCKYIERPNDVRTAYTIAAQILWYYGCKANLEESKIGFRTWLRDKRLDNKMLINRPQYALGDKKRTNLLWGTPASERNILHGLELIRDFIQDKYWTIQFLDMLEQLQKFSYEAKGAFDIVMAMVMCEIGDEDMYDKRPDYEERKTDTWKDIGYYVDDDGKKQYGVIPGKNKFETHVKSQRTWHTIHN